MIIALPLLFAIVGLLIYALSKDGRNQEIGKIMFFCGLLAFLMGANGGSLGPYIGRK